MTHSRARTAAVVATLLLTSSPASATVVLPLDVDGLTLLAESVFVGTVRDMTPHWTSSGRQICTDVTFDGVELLKGTFPGKNYLLHVKGGTIGDRTFHVEGQPRFRVHEQYLLFARQHEWMPIVGAGQGQFLIRDGVVMTSDGLPVVDVQGGRLVLQPPQQTALRSTHPEPEEIAEMSVDPTQPLKITLQHPDREEPLGTQTGPAPAAPPTPTPATHISLSPHAALPIGRGPLFASTAAPPLPPAEFLQVIRSLVHAQR